ncbi:MAG: phosphate ABC transporter substrate-binding protein PstS [Thermoleophilaceae bacterium]|nr:phosphate ABC transporter substrate-binding protein PstS [Thermoleophilaceae bacterium]
MNFIRRTTITGLGAVLLASMSLAVGAGTAGAAVSPTITGSGSTLIAPLITEWNRQLGGGITFGGGGSGKGLTDISSGTVDFGATDAPMTADQKSKCSGCVNIPMSLTAVTISYTVPGISSGLKLTPAIVNDIYKGKIKNWSDAKIKSINKGKSLPNLAITPIHRLDGSGTTYAFADWLARSGTSWRSSPGVGTLLNWPAGPGASGNGGVANALKTTGAIGYVGIDYAIPNKLTVAAIQNAAKKYVLPSQKSIREGAGWIKSVPSSNILHPANPPKKYKNAYPATAFSYVIMRKGSPKAAGLKQMVNFALGKGLGLRQDIGFAPLPKIVATAGKKTAKKL